jgi:hypothetical protein
MLVPVFVTYQTSVSPSLASPTTHKLYSNHLAFYSLYTLSCSSRYGKLEYFTGHWLKDDTNVWFGIYPITLKRKQTHIKIMGWCSLHDKHAWQTCICYVGEGLIDLTWMGRHGWYRFCLELIKDYIQLNFLLANLDIIRTI